MRDPFNYRTLFIWKPIPVALPKISDSNQINSIIWNSGTPDIFRTRRILLGRHYLPFPGIGVISKKGANFSKKLQKTWKEKEGRKSLLKQNHFWWQSFLFFVINDNFRRNCFSAAGSSLSLSASSSLAVAAADETETNFLRFLRKPELG